MTSILRCPACTSGALSTGDSTAQCEGCGADYPVLRGIIDLRDADRDRSVGFDIVLDRARAAKLDQQFDRLATFNGLLDLHSAIKHRVARGEPIGEIEGDRVIREDRVVDQPMSAEDLSHGPAILSKIPLYLEGTGLPPLGDGVALEDGAGLGLFIPGLAARFRHVYVVDLSLAYLLLARKILDERAISNVTLVCASVERLPFAADSIDFIHSNNVIEHVSDQPALFAEARRVLKASGLFFLLSPNRFSLYFEPHFRLPGFGFFPPPLRRWIVRRRQNRDIDEVSLRSLSEVRALAAEQFDAVHASFIPRRLQATATGGALRTIITRILNSPAGAAFDLLANRLALGVMPYHALLCARRPAGSSGS